MNWSNFLSQFLPNLCATLVGFFLALLFQQLVYDIIKLKISDRVKAEKRLGKLLEECDSMEKDYSKIDHKLAYIDPIKTPVWDGLINANELYILANYEKKRIKNENGAKTEINLYKKLFSVYGLISEYNKWWNLYSAQLALGRNQKELEPITACISSLEDNLFKNGEISKLKNLITIAIK